MRNTASKQLQKKRKAEAMNGNEAADIKNPSNYAAAPRKKSRHEISSAKSSGEDIEEENASEDPDDDGKINRGTIKVMKLPGDPFTAARNNLLAQNTTSSTQNSPTPASKLAKLSAKQTTLAFDISSPVPTHSEEVPCEPSNISDRSAAPAAMTDVITPTITGGALGAGAARARTESNQGFEREHSFKEVRKDAKDARESLTRTQDETPSTGIVTEKGHSSGPRQSIFGPAVRTEDQAIEGIEERDARYDKLKSESIDEIGFDNLPVASPSQESVKTVLEEPAADSTVDAITIAIAAEALQVAATDAQASDSEDTITVRPEVPAAPSTANDESTVESMVDGSGATAPKGTVARRSGASSAAELKAGPKKSITHDITTGTIKRGSSNGKPATSVSNAGSPMNSTSAARKAGEPESPARLPKNKDGSLARKPKSAITTATKAALGAKPSKTLATSAAKAQVSIF